MDEFIYLKDGVVQVSDMAMEIPEFKDFKRYDKSTNKTYFQYAMTYIYFVYKIFGDEKSYLYNLPQLQRKRNAVQHHTGPYKNIVDFDGNDWVKKCVEAYLKYSRTSSEKLLDAMRDDIERFIDYVQNVPHTFKKKVVVVGVDPSDPDRQKMMNFDVEIDVPYVSGRIDALKQAEDLREMFNKKMLDVNKDAKKKRTSTTLFEDQIVVGKIPLTAIPKAKE